MLCVPDPVRAKALDEGQQAWLGAIDDLVHEIAADWALELGNTFPDSTEALVLAATTADGEPAVLKVHLPRDDLARHEITVLRLADGDGCVPLLRADESRGVQLTARLGPSLHDLEVAFGERLAILCDAAARVWRPAAGVGLPTGGEKGRWLADWVVQAWESTDRPCSERAVDHAVACAARRIAAHDDERAVLVHGDVHEWNALAAPGGGFALIDPDGLLAEAEYDLGVLMREDPLELLDGDPRARSRWLAFRTGCDEQAIWEWGVVERVSTGLLAERIGLQPVGRQMLRAADLIAESEGNRKGSP